MKPADLLDPETLPDDLQWVSSHYRLHPEDPVYLLIAWHWQRVQKSEDTLQAAIVEMKAALDVRIEALADAADGIAGINTALTEVQNELSQRPTMLSEELESQLREPVRDTVEKLQSMIKSLGPVARSFRTVPKHLLLTTLVTGLMLGALGAIVLGFAK